VHLSERTERVAMRVFVLLPLKRGCEEAMMVLLRWERACCAVEPRPAGGDS
jgi:hypothetical protein